MGKEVFPINEKNTDDKVWRSLLLDIVKDVKQSVADIASTVEKFKDKVEIRFEKTEEKYDTKISNIEKDFNRKFEINSVFNRNVSIICSIGAVALALINGFLLLKNVIQ